MIRITDKTKCCGCTACASICPKQCIQMKADEEGFIYPVIDFSKCVDCGMCEAVCPELSDSYKHSFQVKTFVVRDKRVDVLKNSTSGGVFSSVMEYVIAKSGAVYGVIIDEDNVVKHIRVDSIEDKKVKKIPCSKYVESEIRDIFHCVKTDLDEDILVCFSGTPCQIAGLKSYLKKEYDNLITIDVVCRGNASPLFWKKYVEYQEKKFGGRLIDTRFRNKTYGYHSGTMKLVFDNGKEYYASARTNLFLRAFFKDLCSRPSCYACSFKGAEHSSDLTLYDSWHASELCGIKDDDNGYTNVIVQSEKGALLLHSLAAALQIYPAETQKAIELDGIMVNNSIQWNPAREHFFKKINDDDLEQHCMKFFKIHIKDHLIEKLKKYYYFKKLIGK